MYSFESRIRYSEVDSNKQLTLTGVANYFQDCSTFQSEDLGLGIEVLSQAKRAWILNSWQIVVKRLPALGERITTGTWPYDIKGFYGYRNFIMKDAKDKVCAVANSLWVYMDTVSGHPARVSPDIAAFYKNEPKYPMEYASRKLRLPDNLVEQPPFFVASANIDTNNHVNNSQYILMAEEYLPEGFQAKELRVEYRNAAVLGDCIYPKVSCQEEQCTVALADEKQKIFAILAFIGK